MNNLDDFWMLGALGFLGTGPKALKHLWVTLAPRLGALYNGSDWCQVLSTIQGLSVNLTDPSAWLNSVHYQYNYTMNIGDPTCDMLVNGFIGHFGEIF